VGAVVSFTGLVRDTDWSWSITRRWRNARWSRSWTRLVHAGRFWGAIVVHRYGVLEVGDPIVLVLTASSHRAEAFQAAEFLMDWLKTRAPFWKKAPEGWVNAKVADDESAERWNLNELNPLSV
jgi:molybdopterin synthase catalytic subunit